MDLDKKTIAEIRSYAHPPKLVHDVMRASLLLLGDHEGKTRVIAIILLQSSRREPLVNDRGLLKVPHQFDFFLLVSFQIHFAKIQTCLVSTMKC